MYFNQVAQYFSQIEATSGRLEIISILAELFKKATPNELGILAHLVLGQLQPPHKGTQFNIAEKNMLKVVALVLDWPIEKVKNLRKEKGDLGSVLEQGVGNYKQIGLFDSEILMTEAGKKEGLFVEDVYEKLCSLEKITGSGSQEVKSAELVAILKSVSPLSAKYIVRIIMGKLRLGFSAMTLIEALSWMIAGDKSLRPIIENAYNICADMGFIAKSLKEKGIDFLEQMSMQVGVPVLPAAAERLNTAEAIFNKIGLCIAQPKLDGFRLQVHIDNTQEVPKIHFFSRNLSDMSAMFPDLVQVLKKLPVKTLICEGEAIVYDHNAGSFVPFQETVKRKRKHGIEKAAEEMPLQIFLFDLLYLNGVSYLNESHTKRRQELLSIFENFKSSTIQPIEEKKVVTAQALEEYFNENIAAGLEGLVVKKESSIYQPGKRNFNWIKLKRQQAGYLSDTIDAVILGYYYGSGRRAQFGIGAFLVGIYNKEKDTFQTVAKVGTGLSDVDLQELKKKCDNIQIQEKPKNVECAQQLFPDVWTSPELVCVVRADEITFSPVHTAGKTISSLGYAMRFPRFMGYRKDKSAQEATTNIELKQMFNSQFNG